NFLDRDAADRSAVGDEIMRIIGGAQQVAVETAALACAGQTSATVAQRNGDRVVGMTWRNQGCNFQLPRCRRRWWSRSRFTFDGGRSGWDDIVDRDLNEVARLYPKRFGVAWADQSRVIPSQFRDWIGHLLQPGVVDVTAIVD